MGNTMTVTTSKRIQRYMVSYGKYNDRCTLKLLRIAIVNSCNKMVVKTIIYFVN